MTNTTALVFASGLDYAIVSSAPPIHRDDIAAWKTRVSPDVEHHFLERYDELRQQYERLLESYETNRLLYNSEINFTPVVGQTYYLYEYRDKRFLSLIAPEHSGWPGYLGTFRLSSSHVWERV
jgi:hypothetical protein